MKFLKSFSELFFEALIPIISSKSIQLTNGIEAKERHKRLSEALGHYVCVEKLSQFIQASYTNIHLLQYIFENFTYLYIY